MNVMLTCAGRRNYLVRFFQEALGSGGKVFAGDADSSAPALKEADKGFLLPEVRNETYIDRVMSICQQHSVDMLLSLNDLELPLLARASRGFEALGVQVIVSSPSVIDICFDKFATEQFVRDCGLMAPRTYTSLENASRALSCGELSFPLVVKPRWGSASFGISYVYDEEELSMVFALTKGQIERSNLNDSSVGALSECILIQEKLEGDEYGLDVVNDLKGNYVCTFAKRKIGMRAGETDRAVTLDDPRLIGVGEVLGRNLGHVGNLDCDVFVNFNGCYVLELNPRFGGGYPFSHIAGANLPAALIAWVQRREPDETWFQIQMDVTASKCDNVVVVDPGAVCSFTSNEKTRAVTE